jgi:HEAT repeat protein
VPTLIETLTDSNRDVRASTAYSLAMIGFPSMLALSNVIAHGDTNAREAAVNTLIRFHHSLRLMVPSLVEMAKSEVPASRRKALEALGVLRVGDNASMAALGEGLKDPSPEVRLAAVKSLNLVIWRAESTLPQLIACLDDDSAAVQEWSAVTLGNLGARAAPAIPELKRLATTADQGARTAAIEALKKIGD